MSFFGFEQRDLEQEKKTFLEGGSRESEDVAVYTWGEDGYDGLGDSLQEGGDDFNDETFGVDAADIGNPLSLRLLGVLYLRRRQGLRFLRDCSPRA